MGGERASSPDVGRIENAEDIKKHLKKPARKKIVAHYSDVVPLVGLDISQPSDRHDFGRILDALIQEQVGSGRPLVSAAVVQKNSLKPGRDFFTLARNPGRFDGIDEDAYYIKELRTVHDYWREH